MPPSRTESSSGEVVELLSYVGVFYWIATTKDHLILFQVFPPDLMGAGCINSIESEGNVGFLSHAFLSCVCQVKEEENSENVRNSHFTFLLACFKVPEWEAGTLTCLLFTTLWHTSLWYLEREHPPPGVFWTPVIVFADVCKTPFAVLSVSCSVSTHL